MQNTKRKSKITPPPPQDLPPPKISKHPRRTQFKKATKRGKTPYVVLVVFSSVEHFKYPPPRLHFRLQGPYGSALYSRYTRRYTSRYSRRYTRRYRRQVLKTLLETLLETLHETLLDTLHETLLETLHDTLLKTLIETLLETIHETILEIFLDMLHETLHERSLETLTVCKRKYFCRAATYNTPRTQRYVRSTAMIGRQTTCPNNSSASSLPRRALSMLR